MLLFHVTLQFVSDKIQHKKTMYVLMRREMIAQTASLHHERSAEKGLQYSYTVKRAKITIVIVNRFHWKGRAPKNVSFTKFHPFFRECNRWEIRFHSPCYQQHTNNNILYLTLHSQKSFLVCYINIQHALGCNSAVTYSEHRPQASAQPQAPTGAEALTVIAFEKIRWRNFHDFP